MMIPTLWDCPSPHLPALSTHMYPSLGGRPRGPATTASAAPAHTPAPSVTPCLGSHPSPARRPQPLQGAPCHRLHPEPRDPGPVLPTASCRGWSWPAPGGPPTHLPPPPTPRAPPLPGSADSCPHFTRTIVTFSQASERPICPRGINYRSPATETSRRQEKTPLPRDAEAATCAVWLAPSLSLSTHQHPDLFITLPQTCPSFSHTCALNPGPLESGVPQDAGPTLLAHPPFNLLLPLGILLPSNGI